MGNEHFGQLRHNLSQRVWDDILMWSHYAEQHKGVCLQFRFELPASFPDLPLPVDYKEHYPEFNFAEQFSKVGSTDAERKVMREFGRTVFLTKSSHWKYEKEWRIIRIALDEQPKFGSSTFPLQLLTGLILGCRMDGSAASADRIGWRTRTTTAYF